MDSKNRTRGIYWRIALFICLPLLSLTLTNSGCSGNGGGEQDGTHEPPIDWKTDELGEMDNFIDTDTEENQTEDNPAHEGWEEETEDAEADEVILHGCGNGIVEEPEVCDDGNRVTEFCGRWNDCLGDCSMKQANCGNGVLDPGEECDDGNSDNFDYCTNSCNINDHGIGAPCECPNCFGVWITTPPIYGCEGVEIPENSGGVLACGHTLVEEYSGYHFYAPGGYCSIYAMKCIGDEADCVEIEDIGNIDTFACPPGYPAFGIMCRGTGGIGIAIMYCVKPCDSPAQCRWNEYDEKLDECGRQDCITPPNDPLHRICFDERNYNFNLPAIDCDLF